MESEDLPTWVPEPVRRSAAVYGAGHPLMKRLLSDPTMEEVWASFETQAVEEDFRARFTEGTNLDAPDLHGVDLHWHDTPASSQALVYLFFAILVAVDNARETPDSKLIDGEVEKLHETKRLLSDLRFWAPWPTLKVEPQVESAIEAIVTLCDERIALLDYSKRPGVVEVKGPESTIRSTVRSIGAATYALYGQCGYGKLAVMANAIFAPEQPVKSADVGHWCTRPSLPMMPKQNGNPPKTARKNGRSPRK